MTVSVRTQVRDAFVALLINAGTAAGDQVTGKRFRSYDPNSLPALEVITGDTDVEVFAMGSPSPLQHDLEVAIRCLQGGADVEDNLDALAAEVHAAVVTNQPAFVFEIQLQKIETSVEVKTDKLIGHQILIYSVSYQTRGDDLTAAL